MEGIFRDYDDGLDESDVHDKSARAAIAQARRFARELSEAVWIGRLESKDADERGAAHARLHEAAGTFKQFESVQRRIVLRDVRLSDVPLGAALELLTAFGLAVPIPR